MGVLGSFAHIRVRKINFPEYKAFELLPLYVRVGTLSFAFIVVYRPDPASAVTNDFFIDFADVLERTSSFSGCVIVGDVNLHLDTVSAHTTQFVTLLNSFGLVDYVRQPTRGVHQLDVFISRSDQPAPVCRVDPPLISDHSLIVASFEVTNDQAPRIEPISRRC